MPNSWRLSKLRSLQIELAKLHQQLMIWKQRTKDQNNAQLKVLNSKLDKLRSMVEDLGQSLSSDDSLESSISPVPPRMRGRLLIEENSPLPVIAHKIHEIGDDLSKLLDSSIPLDDRIRDRTSSYSVSCDPLRFERLHPVPKVTSDVFHLNKKDDQILRDPVSNEECENEDGAPSRSEIQCQESSFLKSKGNEKFRLPVSFHSQKTVVQISASSESISISCDDDDRHYDPSVESNIRFDSSETRKRKRPFRPEEHFHPFHYCSDPMESSSQSVGPQGINRITMDEARSTFQLPPSSSNSRLAASESLLSEGEEAKNCKGSRNTKENEALAHKLVLSAITFLLLSLGTFIVWYA